MPKKSTKTSKATKIKPEIKETTKTSAGISSGLNIFKKALTTLNKQRKTFAYVILIYGALELLLVKGFSATNNISELKNLYNSTFHGSTTATNLSIFGTILGNSASGTQTNSNLYLVILFLVFALIIIWLLRQTLAPNSPKVIPVSDAFYYSMYPLIQFTIVALLLLVELIPFVIGAYIYGAIFGNSLISGAFGIISWAAVCVIFISLSIWLLISTLFAFYIVTLPNVRPVKAIKSSWELTHKRKFLILRKVLFIFLIFALVLAVIGIPVVAIYAPAAEWVILALTILIVPVIHSYMYTLYRELI